MSDSNKGNNGGGTARISAAEGKRLGLPEDLKSWSATPFGTLNQEDARTLLGDSEFFWLENYILTGKGELRTLWDNGAAFYNAPANRRIVYFSWFNIADDVACAVFINDGLAYQVAYPSGAVTTISSVPGTFYSNNQLPVACQSGEQYLLIANDLTANSYWIWDGLVLYGAGTLGPYQIGDLTSGGSGYSSAPTVTFFGGSGTGATGTATVSNGSVVEVAVTNAGTGYVAGDAVQMAFTGGGSDTSARLTAVLSSGNVDHLEIISGGSAYTTAPTVSITGGGGAGATAIAQTNAGNVVSALIVTNGGSGYTSTPSVGFAGGGGAGATAVAVLSPASVASVTVVSGGTGYTGTPNLTFAGGGGGAGAAATAVMAAGVIGSVTVTAGGTGYTTVPTLVVDPLNRAAAGSIEVMPFGVSGTSIESFLSRVWVSKPAQLGTLSTGGTILTSAPASLTDFSTSSGGNLFNSSDRFLRTQYIALHQSNGYLYPIGDSSVSVISNVQTQGSPVVTTFNYYNVNAQIGSSWRDTVQDFGQYIVFANTNGIYAMSGGAVRVASRKVLNIFDEAVYPPTTGALTPSAAVANIHTLPVYVLLFTVTDPLTGTRRNVMLGWDEKEWFVASQSVALTFIGTQTISSKLSAWGTNGTSLYPLFTTPSSALTKTLVTKWFASEREFIVKEPMALYLRATDKSTGQAGIAMTATMQATGIAQQIGQTSQLTSMTYPLTVQPNFYAPRFTEPVWASATPAVAGTALGVQITSTSPDFVLSALTVTYRDIAPIYS